MTTSIDSRPRFRTLRRASPPGSVAAPPTLTRGPSPSLTDFNASVRRLFRCTLAERSACLRAVIDHLAESRYPDRCVNHLADEASHRGGMYGLDLAAHVLSQFPKPLLRVIDSYFRKDSARRTSDRGLSYPRHRVCDEVWGVFLDALARTSPDEVRSTLVFDVLRRVERSATMGMREGIAAAAPELAERGESEKLRAAAFLRRMLLNSSLSQTARQSIEGYISDLGG